MSYAEKHHLIAPEQFGSRKRHAPIDQVLIKTLFYDVLRMKRQDGYLCSNDAKACYDRITHSIASLALQRVGLPIAPINCMLTSLQHMQHYTSALDMDSQLHPMGDSPTQAHRLKVAVRATVQVRASG